MKLGDIDSFTLEIITKLYADQELSTSELREALQRSGVHYVLIDYIADLHAHKVEGKTSTPTTVAKRSMQKRDAFIAFSNEIVKAKRNGEKITETEAIKRASRRTGVAPSTLRRHLKQSSRKK